MNCLYRFAFLFSKEVVGKLHTKSCSRYKKMECERNVGKQLYTQNTVNVNRKNSGSDEHAVSGMPGVR